jgi:nuclear receptor subfamily 2 group E protein 1
MLSFSLDLAMTTEDAKRLESIQDRTQVALAHYAAQSSPHQPWRFGRLLLALPVLCGPTAQGLQTVLFRPIIGDVPVEHVIASI